MRSVLLLVQLFLLFVLGASAPLTRSGAAIRFAGGLALSTDKSTAFVSTLEVAGASNVYIVALPITANTVASLYYTAPSGGAGQWRYLAASASASPQLLWLGDVLQNRVVQLVYSPGISPAAPTTVIANMAGIINGMYYQASTNLLFLSMNAPDRSTTTDFIGVVNPAAASPVLTTLYTTSFYKRTAGLAVSSTTLYYSTFTSFLRPNASTGAAIYSVPLSNLSSASSLLYTTNNAANPAAATTTSNTLAFPTAFEFSPDGSILYITDQGDAVISQNSAVHSVFALSALYNPSSPLNLITIYSAIGTSRQASTGIAVSDQTTVYFTFEGDVGGLAIISKANSSLVLPPRPNV